MKNPKEKNHGRGREFTIMSDDYKEFYSDVAVTISRDQNPTPFSIEIEVYLYPSEMSLWLRIFWIYITA